MKNIFFNTNIRNLVIAGFWRYLLTYLIVAPLVTSLWTGSTLQQSFMQLGNWILTNFYSFVISFLAAAIIFITLYAAYLLKNPIKWNFEGVLGMSGEGKDGVVYNWHVSSFQATGKNRLWKPILNIDGWVEVHSSKLKFPLMLNKNGKPVDLRGLISLPPQTEIGLVAFFAKDIENYGSFKGFPASDFLLKFTPFTFVVFINGKEYHYTFSEAELSKFIQDQSKQAVKPQKQAGLIYRDE